MGAASSGAGEWPRWGLFFFPFLPWGGPIPSWCAPIGSGLHAPALAGVPGPVFFWGGVPHLFAEGCGVPMGAVFYLQWDLITVPQMLTRFGTGAVGGCGCHPSLALPVSPCHPVSGPFGAGGRDRAVPTGSAKRPWGAGRGLAGCRRGMLGKPHPGRGICLKPLGTAEKTSGASSEPQFLGTAVTGTRAGSRRHRSRCAWWHRAAPAGPGDPQEISQGSGPTGIRSHGCPRVPRCHPRFLAQRKVRDSWC